MEWVDDAIVIGLRQHGESAVIAELLTETRGRQRGYVHGGRSRRLRPTLQPGNRVRASWQSRQEEGLGRLTVEPVTLRAAALMETVLSLQATNHICGLLRLLPEREPHGLLFAMAEAILSHADDHAGGAAALVRMELALLRDLGFGLDLARCAVTGSDQDLAFVSPRSGRAVTRSVGNAYRDRILALPAFVIGAEDDGPVSSAMLREGFALTEHFLRRDIFEPRGLAMPDCRAAYLDALVKALARGAAAAA